MTRRPQAWVIVEQEDGDHEVTFDVLHGRTSVATGLRDLSSARTIVISHRKIGERVWKTDRDDGYRTELTRTLPVPEATSQAAGRAAVAVDPDRPARSRYLARYGRSARPGRWL